MNNERDLELAKGILNQDKEVFEEVISLYQDKAYNLCLRITRNEHDAEEAVQDLFSTVYRKINTFKGDSKFSSWIFRIATNCALMKLRTRKRQTNGNVEFDILDIPTVDACSSERSELRANIEKAVNQLPEMYKQVFIAKDVDGLSSENACELLNLSMTAFKSRLHRARFMLRKKLVK